MLFVVLIFVTLVTFYEMLTYDTKVVFDDEFVAKFIDG